MTLRRKLKIAAELPTNLRKHAKTLLPFGRTRPSTAYNARLLQPLRVPDGRRLRKCSDLSSGTRDGCNKSAVSQ